MFAPPALLSHCLCPPASLTSGWVVNSMQVWRCVADSQHKLTAYTTVYLHLLEWIKVCILTSSRTSHPVDFYSLVMCLYTKMINRPAGELLKRNSSEPHSLFGQYLLHVLLLLLCMTRSVLVPPTYLHITCSQQMVSDGSSLVVTFSSWQSRLQTSAASLPLTPSLSLLVCLSSLTSTCTTSSLLRLVFQCRPPLFPVLFHSLYFWFHLFTSSPPSCQREAIAAITRKEPEWQDTL